MMSEIIRTLKCRPLEWGSARKVGHYVVYSHVAFKTPEELDFQVFRIENVAVEEKMAHCLDNKTIAVQIIDAGTVNKFIKLNYVCAIQDKQGYVYSDDKILKVGYKGKLFAAIALTVLPPLTLVAPLYYWQANKLKKALAKIGDFDPIEEGFVRTGNKKKF
jgi:hypothetical protein